MNARVLVGLWLAVLGTAIWLLVARTTFVADLTAFLPRPETPGQELLLGQLADGIASRLLLIGIEGDAPESLTASSKAVAQALRASGRFRYVANGESELPRSEREVLFALRYHLSPTVTAERFSVAGLRAGLEQMLEQLASPLGAIVRPLLARDPTGEFLSLLRTQQDRVRPPTRDGVWYDAKHQRVLLMVESATPGYDAKAQRAVQDFIHETFASQRAGSSARLLMTGPAVFAQQTQDAIERDAWRLTLISAALVIAILAVAYRSLRLPLLAFLPVFSGLVVAIAAVGLTFGACHVITIGFGATLVGEAVDYPTFLFGQRQAHERTADTARRIGRTLSLAILTTVLGAIAMVASSFVGIAQLGLFTLVGVGTAGLVTRYVLPVLAPQPPLLGLVVGDHAARVLEGAMVALRRLAWLVPAALVIGAAYLAMMAGAVWERDLDKLSPIDDADKRIDQQLREALGAPDVRYLVVVRAAQADEVLAKFESLHARLDALRDAGVMASYDSPARYLPSDGVQRARLAGIPEMSVLRSRMAQALEGLPYQDGLFEPFIEEATKLRSAAPITAKALEQMAWGLGLRSLMFESGGRWIGLAPVAVVREPPRLAQAVAEWRDPQVSFFDLKVESDSLVSDHGWRSLVLGVMGLGVIVIVLAVGQRNARLVVRTLLPILAAIALTAALIVAAGTRISFLHVVSLVMVLGTGVNYALFFISAANTPAQRSQTTLAVLIANSTTLCGFGVLIFADTPILRTIGLTVVIGAALSFLFAAAWASRASERAAAP